MTRTASIAISIAILCSISCAHAHTKIVSAASKPKPDVLKQHLKKDSEYQPLVEGNKQSVSLESGRVTILRGNKGERHSTKSYEEILIVLRGKGSIDVEGTIYPLEEGDTIYIPPQRFHQLRNERSDSLEYIYVAAPAAK